LTISNDSSVTPFFFHFLVNNFFGELFFNFFNEFKLSKNFWTFSQNFLGDETFGVFDKDFFLFYYILGTLNAPKMAQKRKIHSFYRHVLKYILQPSKGRQYQVVKSLHSGKHRLCWKTSVPFCDGLFWTCSSSELSVGFFPKLNYSSLYSTYSHKR
jgi:hypothetical protein